MPTRRAILKSAAALAATALPLQAAVPVLRASSGTAQLGPSDMPRTPVWAYGDAVPGPEIRVKRGDRVVQRFANDLPQPSSVHWHGIRIDNAMDGVAGLTQPAVPTGQDFLYDFTAPDAGTYWYHPHNRTWEQLARGLYGPLIVEEDTPPEVDRDLTLMIDDWRLNEDATLHDSFGSLMDWSHAGRLGNWVTVNGEGEYSTGVQHGERLRLRLINASNARVYSLALKGLDGWVVALDGQPVDQPTRAQSVTLAPAQRVDLIVDVTGQDGAEAFLTSHEGDQDYAIATFDVRGEMRAAPLPAPEPLAPNDIPALTGLETARTADLLMEGGAMGGMQSAMLKGEMRSARDLAGEGMVWAFNGMAGMPETPMLSLERGETVRITMRNDTGWPHAMHLHGHHFRTVAADGTFGPLRDTQLIQRGEAIEIAFVADNPGDWLLHCHMVEHAASGMMTWIKVSG